MGRVPTEFRYWEAVDQPWVRLLRKGASALLGVDPAPPEDVVASFADSYYQADPIAEAFVDEVYLVEGVEAGRAMLDKALEDGAPEDAPSSLKDLLSDVDQTPEWLDWERVEHGARVFRRYGPAVFQFAGAITLSAYTECSVAKPLALTGGYAGDSARRRFLETARFWIDVSEPGGMRRGQPGWLAALRVRIMHVFIRRRLLDHPEWDAAAWGVPISQSDALLTLMGGSFAPGVAMQAMGYRPSRSDIEAMMHFWRYIGHLMGVRPEHFPESLEQAAQLSFMALLRGARRAGDDGRNLCHAFLRAFAPHPDQTPTQRLRSAWQQRLHAGYTRFFLDPWSWRHNRLPNVGVWALHPLAQFPFIFAAETARRMFPALDAVADRHARRQRHRWLAARFGERKSSYRPVDRFTR